MTTLLIPLVGPMQSWGMDSRFDFRHTATEPTKSAVIGLLCCCLGRDRSEPTSDLTALRFGVRVDQEGTLLRDFHTVSGVPPANYQGKTSELQTLVSQRWYLTDAAFTVGVESGDRNQLETLHEALKHPFWSPCLGRRSCLITVPLASGGIVDVPLVDALNQAPLQGNPAKDKKPLPRRVLVDDHRGNQLRPDELIGTFKERRYSQRRISTLMTAPL